MKKFLRFTTQKGLLTEESSKALLQTKLLNTPISFLCAVSGGQDSIVSFFLLLHNCSLSLSKSSFSDEQIYPCPKNFVFGDKNVFDQKKKLFWQENPQVEGKKDFLLEYKKTHSLFQVIYYQHFWQTKNFYSSQFNFNLSFFIEIPYTMILPKKISLTENCSRGWRKKNFCRLSRLQKISTVLTGHTRSDTFEKNLNNLLRGTSPKSLSEFSFVNSKITAGSLFSILILQPRNSYKNFFQTKIFNNQIVPQTKKNLKSDLDLKLLFPQNFILGTEKEQVIKKKNTRVKKIKPVRYHKYKEFSFAKNYFQSEKTSVVKKRIKQKSKLGFFPILQSFVNSEFQNTKPFCLVQHKISSSFCFSSKICKNQIKFLKPLQNSTRFTVSKLSTFYDLPVISDVTNFSSLFSRNKIRHQLLPFLRSLFQIKCEFQLTKFFSLLGKQYKQIENKNFEISIVFTLLRGKSLESKEFSLQSTKIINVTFLSTLLNKSELNLHNSLLQKVTYEYTEIELSFSQISDLEVLCKVNKDHQISRNGLPGTRTRN